jgi:hypothetical protein
MKAFLLVMFLGMAGFAFGDEGFMEAGMYLNAQQWHTDSVQQKNLIDTNINLGDLYFLRMGYKAEFFSKLFYLSGDMKTYALRRETILAVEPVYIDYTIGIGLQFGGMEIGATHMCTHPQNTLEGIVSPMEADQTNSNEIHIRFSFKTDSHF